MFLAGQQQLCTAGKPLKEHSCRAARRAGQQSSMPVRLGDILSAVLYITALPGLDIGISVKQLSTWWQQRRRFLEEDRLEKSLQCPTH